MSFQDVCVQVFVIATADRFDEIAKVMAVSAASEDFARFLAIFVEDHPTVVAGHHQVAFAAVENDTDAGFHQWFGLQTSHFEYQAFSILVFVDTDLRIRCLTCVDIRKSSTVTLYGFTKIHFVQAPAGDVHLVDSLVAEVSVSVIPLPVPVVVELRAREGIHGCRT